MRLLRPAASSRGRRSGQGSSIVGRIVVLSAVLLVAFVAGVVIGQTGGDDMVSASALADETGKVTQLRNQVAQLEGDLRTVREQLQVAQSAAPPSTAGDPNASSKSEKDDGDAGSSKSTTTTKDEDGNDDASDDASDGEWTTYTVKSGENLWSVSKNVYGTTGYWKRIGTANGLTSKSELRVGQKLKIPPKPSSSSSSDSSSSSSSGSSSGSDVD